MDDFAYWECPACDHNNKTTIESYVDEYRIEDCQNCNLKFELYNHKRREFNVRMSGSNKMLLREMASLKQKTQRLEEIIDKILTT